MARISISIPDKLMAKLDKIKDGINISQLCRECLEQRVAAFERTAGHDSLDFDGLVKRLRDEKPIEESKFEDLGKSNAGNWLNTAPYTEFKNIAEDSDSSDMSRYKLPKAAFKTMRSDLVEAKADCEGSQSVAYKTAWLDQVKSVWQQASEKLEESKTSKPAVKDTA